MDHTILTKWQNTPFPIPTKTEPMTIGYISDELVTSPVYQCSKVYSHYPGHNTNCDLVAGSRIFNQKGLKISVINNAVTTKAWFTGPHANALLEAATSGMMEMMFVFTQLIGDGEMKVVGLLFEEWLEYRSGVFNTKVDGELT